MDGTLVVIVGACWRVLRRLSPGFGRASVAKSAYVADEIVPGEADFVLMRAVIVGMQLAT